jgi:2-octaprenyl-6-methoxyphenol hydroxylase
MLHDVIIIGTGPVGGALALAIADADLDVVALDARVPGTAPRGDRSLALSHGARLIFERLGVWSRLSAAKNAVTPITTVDISQAGGFGVTRLSADEQDVPALGYVVSYLALQHAIDAELARTRTRLRFGAPVQTAGGTPAYAAVTLVNGDGDPLLARLAVVADGTGATVAGVTRERREYGQVALVAKLWMSAPHGGVAFERFTPDGPMALLPEGDHYGLVWTMTPAAAERALALADDAFLDELAHHFGARVEGFVRVADRKTFPLALEFARPVITSRCVLIGNAAQALHPVAGQGFNLGVRDAFELAQAINASGRDALGDRSMLSGYAARRRVDRYAGIAFTHGLTHLFGLDWPLARWPRGVALTLLDALPPAKKAFTRAMLFGLS